LHSATKRKEGIIASKVESIRIDNETKQARAKDVLLLSLNEATELKRMSDKRLKKATKKKNVVSLNCRANESTRQ
jgi:Asp/Glu/hydantoin racemase